MEISSADGFVGLEGDGSSHIPGAFAWMVRRLGSVGLLTGAPTCSPHVIVASYMLTQHSSEQSENYMAFYDLTL